MSSGHLSVAIGKDNSRLVHVLVLEAFVGPCPDGQESLHGDGIPGNNTLTNLRWGTRTENIIDALNHGAMPRGSKRWNAKLTDADIPIIRRAFGIRSYANIGREYRVSETTIRQIKSGKTWSHIIC